MAHGSGEAICHLMAAFQLFPLIRENLDLEVMTQYCKMCAMNVKREHVCSNYKGSSGNMEAVRAFRIFERSLIKRDLQYTEYYGDGDSKGFLQVKDIYGENSVTKLECIGHIQKKE
ncbi:uncharacterized protein TNCV_4471791 [Trichonephila clavipes]|uniref:Mutator-like transposase domain-containing protein n=1 Tax=Trichonephila clavipes TaxID=2585209 RepID=A0A8X6SQK4_TRICX|nr:uncharacterized protein TNCV_4471791 [Trichonephila clavipes]